MKKLFISIVSCLFTFGALAQVPTNGLVARWKASNNLTTNSSGYISQWVDVINGHVASQTTDSLKPKLWTVLGRPAVLFHHDPAVNTVSNNMEIASTLTNYTRGVSIFSVSDGNATISGSKAWVTLHNFGAPMLQVVMNPVTYVGYMQAGANTSGTLKTYANVSVNWMVGGAASSLVGINHDSQSQSALAAVNTAGGTIGSYGPTKPFRGAMFDLLIYDGAKTAAEAGAIVAALAAEYSIVTNHTATIVARGDSMTESVGQTNMLSWPTILTHDSRFQNVRFVNAGWGGELVGTNGETGTAYMLDTNLVDVYYNPTSGHTNLMLMQMAINDISSLGLTGAAAFGRLTNYIAARHGSNWVVGVATLPARNSLATQVSDYNDLIRAASTNVIAFVSDSGYESSWSPLQDSNDTNYYQVDLFHINGNGQQVVANSFATNLLSYFSGSAPAGPTNILYVATTGDDANPGTEAAPFLTIAKAVTNALPGFTVRVAAGDYSEVLDSFRDGVSTNRILFEGIGFPNVKTSRVRHDYVTVRGFRFTGQDAPVGALMFIDTSASFVNIETNRFWPTVTNQLYGIDAENGAIGTAPSDITLSGNDFLETTFHAIDVQGTNWWVNGNKFEATKGWDAIRNGVFRLWVSDNLFTNWSNLYTNSNHPDIFQAFLVASGTNWIGGSAHVVFQRNRIFNCVGTQIGNVSDDGEQGVLTDWEFRNNLYANNAAAINIAAPNFRFYNNLFYKVGINTGGPLVFRILSVGGEGLYGDVRNNIFFECGANPASTSQGWVGWDAGATNTLTQDYNLVIGTGAGTVKGSSFTLNGWNAHSLNGVNPLFVDAANFDFRPATNSPLIGAGVDLSAAFTDDFTGATRTGAWTIGPYQVAGDAPTPPPTISSNKLQTIRSTGQLVRRRH